MHRLNQVKGHLAAAELTSSDCHDAAGLMKRVGDSVQWLPLGSLVESERHAGELVAEVLKAHGVNFLFTLVGGHISPILVASKAKGIRVIDVRHEVTAMFAADAVARLTGGVGVAAVTAGPGITNTITAVKNAQMAQSPVLLIGGAAATLLKGRGALQDIDQLSVLKPIVKFAATVTRVRDVVPTLRKAFQEAVSGVPGPVFVEFPLDVLYPISEVRSSMGLSVRRRAREVREEDLSRVILPTEAELAGLDRKKFVASKKPDAPIFLNSEKPDNGVVATYMKYKLAQMFAGAWEDTVFSPLPVTYPKPSLSQVSAVCSMLMGAKKPVLIVASQAMLHGPKGAADLTSAVLSLRIPTFLGGMARGLLGRNSPYHIRQNRGMALKGADVVILAGAVADFRLDYGRTLPSRAKIVTINRSTADATLNSGVFWKPTLVCESDPSDFVIELGKAFVRATTARNSTPGTSEVSPFDAWAKQLKKAETDKERKNSDLAQHTALGRSQEKLINPLALFEQLESILPDNSILVADGGDFVATGSYILRPRGGLSWLDPGAFGTLGVGGGFALGAKLVRPDAEVWLLWGDGSAGYSIAEYDTFARHNVPVISLIGNDACWTQIEREQIPMFQDDVACPLAYCDYDEVAKGYGGKGLLVKEPGQAVLENLKQAQLIAKTSPVVINALIGKTTFREGSLSV